MEIVAFVNNELGSAGQEDADLLGCKVYLCLSSTKIVIGCVIVKNVQKAYRAIHSENNSIVSYDETDPLPVICGVCRIWVSKANRKCGIATKMIDCIRYVLNVSNIAGVTLCLDMNSARMRLHFLNLHNLESNLQ